MLNLAQISKADAALLPTLLGAIKDNRVFKKAEFRDSLTKNINNLLSLRESRESALAILNIFCDHHSVPSSSVITEKTCSEIHWIENLLRIVDQEPQYHQVCFEVLAKLIRITSANPDTNKIVQSKYVQKIIEAVLSSTVVPLHSLSCLATCFELHGGTSGIYKNKIYEYCVSFIDVPNDGIAERAALCLHLLQQSRGGSVAGGVYKKCWAEFHEKTLGSLEVLMEQILKKGKGNLGKSEQLQLPELKLSPEPFNMYTQLFVRFQNVVTILRVSLKRPFPTTKTILVSRVITLVEEGINISQALLSKKSITDSMVLSLLHGQIHTNLLEVLVSLMLSLKQNLITHSKTICDILWRCLKQTNPNEQMKFESNLKLRAATYDAFVAFMRISPNNFYIKNVMENLMKEALIDVTPANNEIYLMVPQQNGGKSGKKRKLNADKKFSKGRSHIASISGEQNVCAKALECLGYLLVSQGVLMKPVLFFIMQEKITSIGFMISSKTMLDGDLYRDPLCRCRLSDLMGFMMLHPVNKMPVPINYGIAMLTKVKQSDPDANVRSNAAMNLYRAETAIHNRKDVFYFPPEYSDLKDTLLFNKQTIQKFNESINLQADASKPSTDFEQQQEKPQSEDETEEAQNIVISDEASDDEDDEIESEKLDAPAVEDEVNEISDDESEAAQEIGSSDDEPVIVETEKPEAPLEKPEPQNLSPPDTTSSKPSRNKQTSPEKRSSQVEGERQTRSKKQKISSQNDDDLVNEYLADFNDELV